MATLRDIGSGGAPPAGGPHAGHGHDDDDDDDEDEPTPENWFAGGERRSVPLLPWLWRCSDLVSSGLSIQNPDSGRRPEIPGGDAVREVLRRAAQCVFILLAVRERNS